MVRRRTAPLLSPAGSSGNRPAAPPALAQLLFLRPASSFSASASASARRSPACQGDKSLLATASFDATVKLWDVKARAEREPHSSSRCCAARRVAPAAATEGKARRRLTPSPALVCCCFAALPQVGKCIHSLNKHKDPVYSVAFSPNGARALELFSQRDCLSPPPPAHD